METILILGATSDIGFALANRFAAAGYHTQLAGRNLEQLRTLQTDLQIRYGVNSSIHFFDAVQFSSHQEFYAHLPVKPDLCVYVVGYMNDNETAVRDWNEALKTVQANYVGAVSICNIVAADYAAKKKGAIIGISSVAGNRGRQSNFVYGSAKAGFTAYLSGLRHKLFADGVHVLTVLPGFVSTRMTEHLALPKRLTATPRQVADSVFQAVRRKKNVVYVKWFWRWIMLVVVLLPEPLFKKTKL